jgi:membrane associated rhomboid family serine protease
MIPYKDDNPTRTFPFVTIGFIALNVIVFVIQFSHPDDIRRIVFSYGAIPRSLMTFSSSQPIHPLLTLFSSMFMHGGLLHLVTNMLYLWIFGNNIEDRLGHFRFVSFYLLSGVIAAYAHSITDPSSMIPMIGASGAVAGVLGAYLLLFPHARVHTLIILIFFIQVVRLPAFIVIGFWIVIQILNGMSSSGITNSGGVAWFAHIGGFVFGTATVSLFARRRSTRS